MGISTEPDAADLAHLRRSRGLRLIFFLAITVFLLLGAFGAYGVRHGEVSASGGGFDLSVRYPTMTRPGLASVWSVEVRRTDGGPLDDPVVLSTTADYFDLFDENGLDPDPAAAMSDGENLVWEFEPADGATVMTIGFDARIEPGVQLTSKSGVTTVLVDGAPAVSVTYRTKVMP
ncbi:MAG TPA: hypothetical protein VMY34_03440 [Acidimicrobiales bacterium]|nr:hypothetical protein [Acidimicrobiales bacterium]